MQNPYQFRTKQGEGMSSLKASFGSRKGSRLVSENGEINASSKADLGHQIAALLQEAQSGNITAHYRISADEQSARAETLRAALADRSGVLMADLGEEIGDVVRERVERQGVVRRFLVEKEIGPGVESRIRVRDNSEVGMVVSEDGSEVQPATAAERYIHPPAYYVKSRMLIGDKEISQTGGDILSERMEDQIEAIQVQEDLAFKNLLDRSVAASNSSVGISSFTPNSFSSLKSIVENRGIGVGACWMAGNLTDDLLTGPQTSGFAQYFDPISKHEIVLTGVLGHFLGTEIVTDRHLDSQLRVLNPGEIYFLAHRQNLGQLHIREALSSKPIDGYSTGRPARGWFLCGIQAMGVAGIRGVSKGILI